MDHRSQVTQHVRGRGKITLGFPRRVLGHQRGLYAGSRMVWVSFCTRLLATLDDDGCGECWAEAGAAGRRLLCAQVMEA